jgi:glycerate dehydrogenase
MKIVVLDGFTSNPGDLIWDDLKAIGECEIFDRSPPDQILSRGRDAEILFTNKTVLGREHFAQFPKLKYIGILATGTNVVDLAAARERSITVTNVPAYGTRSVAQATFALLLELTNRSGYHAQTVSQGRWTACADWCYWDFPLIELAGLTLGIVGFGRIGNAVAHIAHAFGMEVVVRNSSRTTLPEFVRQADLEELLRISDVVSLHCPLTVETKHLISRDHLRLMKPTAFLLNTARGPLVDDAALAEALNSGQIAGAGLDVLTDEPPSADNPLLRARNCIITPHNAWATRAARARLLQIAVANVKAFLAGQPQNVVSTR